MINQINPELLSIIGELSPECQENLLRLLKRYCPVNLADYHLKFKKKHANHMLNLVVECVENGVQVETVQRALFPLILSHIEK